mgnify:CR=1 FL=1
MIHHLEGHYPFFIAPTSSCARPNSSAGTSCNTLITSGLCRLLPAPAGRWPFPTLSLQVFPRMLGSRSRRGVGCSCLFLPLPHRPSPHPANGSASRITPPKRLYSGWCFEIVTIPYVQASWFVRHPDLPCRYDPKIVGQPWLLRPSRTQTVTGLCIGYASRPNQAIDVRGLTPH